MAGRVEEEEEKAVFDAEAAGALVKELRGTFSSGKTRSYEWRVSQLKSLLKLCDENENEIAGALRQDLSKPELETIVYEVTISPHHLSR
uniref:Aldehyde dehydrogenase domain-containing protein n=1 Tax=Manihot esculenta TaxID=3983 RepID=A0A2C9U2F0_MANES